MISIAWARERSSSFGICAYIRTETKHGQWCGWWKNSDLPHRKVAHNQLFRTTCTTRASWYQWMLLLFIQSDWFIEIQALFPLHVMVWHPRSPVLFVWQQVAQHWPCWECLCVLGRGLLVRIVFSCGCGVDRWLQGGAVAIATRAKEWCPKLSIFLSVYLWHWILIERQQRYGNIPDSLHRHY